jgi:anti-sigma-K factor RskA
MTEMSHEARRDEIASYLLGALDPGEVADLEQHLAECGDCRRELERLRPAALVLPETVERVDPPPGLRARIMDDVRADVAPQRGAAAGSRRWTEFWRRPGGLRMAVGMAVLVVAVAIAGGYALRGADSGGGTSTVVAGEAPNLTAEMVSEGDTGTLRLANVEQLPPDEVLQAWVQRGETVESAGVLFVPDASGRAAAAIEDLDGVDAVMVSVEPQGGSPEPTSEPLIRVPLTS